MKKIFLCLLLFHFSINFAQNNVIKHKVAKGETITKIAQKYNITPLDIYKLNPDAQAGISENTLLIIPVKNLKVAETIKKQTSVYQKHTVVPKETLFSIAKLYGINIAEIEANNPESKNGLSIGQVLSIPSKNKALKSIDLNKGLQQALPVLHEVKEKETKYGIAKQYGITIEELENKNPEIIGKELPLGYNLLIKGERPKVVVPIVQPKTDVVSEAKPIEIVSNNYVVKPQETLYGLANQFGCTQEELTSLNPELKDGVREGMTLKIPAKKTIVIKNEYVDLTKSVKKNGVKKFNNCFL